MATSARARAGLLAVLSLGIAWGLVMHAMGWTQLSQYAQVRALAAGRSQIDRWHWQTKDKAWIDGHFYSVKAPGLAALTLPAYLGLDALGAQSLTREAAVNASRADHPRWNPHGHPEPSEYGFSAGRARRTETQVARATPMVWALTLLGAVLPAVGLLLLVRRLAERIEPGYGTAAAITLGMGTVVMTFAAEYFSHVAAATLGFAAFALLFHEREGVTRAGFVAAAGLLAGLAFTFEYPLGLLAVILLGYALARPGRIRRAVAYTAGAIAGAAPALAFNLWSLGSPVRFAYSDAVAVQGVNGHAVLGLNDSGFFGITAPRPGAALDLLVAGRGLLTLTPVLAMAVVGVVLMGRRGHRAEAAVIGAVGIGYFIYNAGYWLPFGGGSPGPRFLIPTLPFLAIGLAPAYRRFPALTLGLAIPSAAFMLAAMLTFPLLGVEGTGTWANQFANGTIEHTPLTALGVHNGWLAATPVLAAVGAAITFCALATPRVRLADTRTAVRALVAWTAVSVIGPTVAGDSVTPLDGSPAALALIAFGALVSLATLLLLRYRELRWEDPAAGLAGPRSSPLGERIS